MTKAIKALKIKHNRIRKYLYHYEFAHENHANALRRIMIHSCLFTGYLQSEGSQPCEAPHRGFGVDSLLITDKIIIKQE